MELEQLLGHVRSVVPDKLLVQLLSEWLKPDTHGTGRCAVAADLAPASLPSCAPSPSSHAHISATAAAAEPRQQQQVQEQWQRVSGMDVGGGPAAGAVGVHAHTGISSSNGGAKRGEGSGGGKDVAAEVGCGRCCGQPELCLGVQPEQRKVKEAGGGAQNVQVREESDDASASSACVRR